MQQPDIKLNLSELKFELPQISLINFDLSSFNAKASMALQTYQRQTEAQKRQSPFRFWIKPDTLKERCLQMLAAKELQTGKHCDRSALPADLRTAIDDRLATAERRMFDEQLIKNINTTVPSYSLPISESIHPMNYEMSSVLRDFLLPAFNQAPDIKLNKLNEDEMYAGPGVIVPGAHQYRSDIAKVKKNAELLCELHASRTSFFSRLPKDILVEIASRMRDTIYLNEEEAKSIARNHTSSSMP